MAYNYKCNSISQTSSNNPLKFQSSPLKFQSSRYQFKLKKMSSFQAKQCQAREYGDCYLHVEEFDVTFMFRNFNGDRQPDEVVKICMCNGHYKWLSKINQGNPLQMRGENVSHALHDDLFAPLEEKIQMFTLMKVEFAEKKEDEFHLFNGRNLNTIRMVIKSYYPNDEDKIGIHEEGFFQTTFQYNKAGDKCDEVVVEVKKITDELALEALANGRLHVNMMTPESKCINIGKRAFTLVPRLETDPLYVQEPMPKLFKSFFQERKEAQQYINFQECIGFIESEIDRYIINWGEVHDKTDKKLFEKSQQLTNALLEKDEGQLKEMLDAGDISRDVLWVTYITANHRLFASRDPNKDLTKSKELVDLFVSCGLEKKLLSLAIAGERERFLFVKMRAHYNILHENEFVVEYLVPRVISGTDIVYKCEDIQLTPLEYWKYYDNTTSSHNMSSYSGLESIENFEKNENIRLHLEQNTPGKLDVNVLSADALSFYNQIKENLPNDAEFVILGYPALFEYRPLSSSNNFKPVTVEEGEKILPGITASFEEKKRKLRANDYAAWEKINATLLMYKND